MKLPEHLLPTPELPETILKLLWGFGVHAPWHIYYLHNSDADRIYFLFQMSHISAQARGPPPISLEE